MKTKVDSSENPLLLAKRQSGMKWLSASRLISKRNKRQEKNYLSSKMLRMIRPPQ